MDGLANLSTAALAGGALAALFVFALGNALALWMVVMLPADYFHSSRDADPRRTRFALARTALGLLLIPLGLFMCLPGVIGPGLLTVLIGVMLIESPRRRAWERRLIAIPSLRKGINALRARFRRPLLELDE